MSRQLARQKAFSLVYEYAINREYNIYSRDLIVSESGLKTQDAEYCTNLYNLIVEKFDELTGIIADFSVGFSLDRIFKVDLAILLVALCEMKFMPDIPVKVSCNEAVELAKTFSTAKSPSFINGILAKVVGGKDGANN